MELAGSGMRSNSSDLWRRRDDVFSRSEREEDDEEALRWAALEKLPTYDRIRRGLLTHVEGGFKEVEILGLGRQERKELLERLVRVAEVDNERLLLKLQDRIAR